MLGRPDPLRVLPRGCGYARLGFRLVVPYLDACRVRVKAAWVGRKIEQVILEHLPFVSEPILVCAFETERVLVDGRVVGPSHSLSLGQTWEMVFHRHETENDGSVQGRRYFRCKPSHGLFVKPEKATHRGINCAKIIPSDSRGLEKSC